MWMSSSPGSSRMRQGCHSSMEATDGWRLFSPSHILPLKIGAPLRFVSFFCFSNADFTVERIEFLPRLIQHISDYQVLGAPMSSSVIYVSGMTMMSGRFLSWLLVWLHFIIENLGGEMDSKERERAKKTKERGRCVLLAGWPPIRKSHSFHSSHFHVINISIDI